MKQATTYKIDANGTTMYIYPNIHYYFDILNIIPLQEAQCHYATEGL